MDGCGTDAAPYFRIFNPVTQGRKFDSQGACVRRWAPELAGLDAATRHAPWHASPLALAAAGVLLGVDYPAPIVDHGDARRRALGASPRCRSIVSRYPHAGLPHQLHDAARSSSASATPASK